MSDPVAEAAANLAKQQSDPSLLEKAMDTIHDLEAKVEHLIHPESVPNVTPGSPATDASATLSGSLGQSIENASSAKPSDSLSTGAPVLASAIELSALSATIPTSSAGSDLPNVLPASTSGTPLESTPSASSSVVEITIPIADIKPVEAAEVPNAVSGAAESTTVTDSASPASGSGETLSIGANSGDGMTTTLELPAAPSVEIDSPLHVRIAAHLEAIYSLAKMAPVAAATDTIGLKTHVGDILHRISNGMAVTEGELVQKLESLYRML